MSLQKKGSANAVKLLLLLTVSFYFLSLLPFDSLKVLSPVVLVFFTFVIFYHRIRKIEGDQAFVNVGIFYALVVSIYVSFPLIGFVLRGLSYGYGSGVRLLQLDLTPDEVTVVGMYGAIHIIVFSIAFLFYNKTFHILSNKSLTYKPPVHAIYLVFFSVALFMFVRNFTLSMGSLSYLDRYLAVWQMPLILRQISNHVAGIYIISFIGILTYWVGNFKKYKLLIICFLGYELISTIISMGGRSEVVQFLIATAMLYHLFVKKLSGKFVLFCIVIGVVSILSYGVLRSVAHYGGQIKLGTNLLSENNEFESVFATGAELMIARENNQLPEIPWQLRFGDFFSLIPQQLVPFQKKRYSDWYLDNFHPEYKEAGGGLAFGAVPEAIVGFGLWELIARAILLGWLFSLIHRWYSSRKADFWATCFYIWLVVESYQCFRAGNFVLFIYIFYRFLPYYIAVTGLSIFIRRLVRGS